MTENKRYTVTVYVAAPGTPIKNEPGVENSLPGHMYYVISDGNTRNSYGFAPTEHGSLSGPGDVVTTDEKNYQNPVYARTMEITKEQYDKLQEFGKHPEDHKFDKNYGGLGNNCIDFTWKALEFADIKSYKPRLGVDVGANDYHGLKPVENVDFVKAIRAPLPNSPLNAEHTNPMPDLEWKKAPIRSYFQYKLSENDLAPEVRDALPTNLTSEQKTNIAAVVNTDPSTCKNYKVFDAYVDGNELGVCYQNKNNKEAFVEKTFDLNLAANTPAQQTVQANEQIMAQNLAQSQSQSQGRSMSMS